LTGLGADLGRAGKDIRRAAKIAREHIPSKEAFEASAAAARERLRANNAFEHGGTAFSGAGGLDNLNDAITLLGAQVGVGGHKAAEIATAAGRQIKHLVKEGTLIPEAAEAPGAETAAGVPSAEPTAPPEAGGSQVSVTSNDPTLDLQNSAIPLGAQLGSGEHATGLDAYAREITIKDHLKQDREQNLTPQELDGFAKVAKDNPEIGAVADFMNSLEVKKALANPEQVEAMTRMLRVLPEAEKMSAMMVAGLPKLGWYRGSAEAIQNVFKDDAPRFAQLLAATSPRISVEVNLRNALNIWKNWVAEGRPQDPQDILRIMAKSVEGKGTEKSVLDAWRNNTYAALTSKDPMSLTLSGPKVNSFQYNLRDYVFHVTNDAWMANAFNVAQDIFQGRNADTAAGNPGMTPEYAAASARLRQAAAKVGMFPNQGQETIWSVAMQLYEIARKNGISPREVLQRQLITPKEINATPDFSTLFAKHPEYLRILDEAGYGDVARALKPFTFPGAHQDVSSMPLSQQNLLMESAGTIGEVMGMRDRESRAGQIAVPRGWTEKIPKATSKSEASLETRQKMLADLYPKTASGVTNLESVPGGKTRHLEDIIDLPFSGRKHYTSTVYGGQQDLANQDIIQKASGLATTPSQKVQGAYLNAVGQARYKAGLKLRPQDIETNPGLGLGYETELQWNVPDEMPGQPRPYSGPLEPSMHPQAKADLEGSMALQALINAQEGVGSNVTVPTALRPDVPEGYQHWVAPEPTMHNFVVPLKEEAPEDILRTLQRRYPQHAFASAGHDMHVLGLYSDLGLPNEIKYTDALRIQRLLGGEKFVPAENAGTYVDVAEKWDKMWGSREVTGEVIDKVKQMSPAAYAKLDQDVRQVAGDTLVNYEKQARIKKTDPRPDLMNALEIISKYGIDGLEAAYNNKAFLPGIAAAVLLPPLLKSANEAEKSSVR
jgi:hypothetical protein